MEDQDNHLSQEETDAAEDSPAREALSNEAGSQSGKRRRWIAVVVLLVVAAVALALVMKIGAGRSKAGQPVAAPSFDTATAPPADGASMTVPRPGEIVLTISAEQLESAQIETEAAVALEGASATEAGLRTTGTVQPNAYKETPVFPIAGGIVREVKAELGDRIRQGQVIAVVFSTELAEAQAEYLKMMAELEEHHQHYTRTAELLEIGAVSREELERVTSMHKTAEAKLASVRQQLILLGMTEREADALHDPDQVQSLVTVPAPVSGTVISRTVNPGEVVEKGKELFRVVDLSHVWVIGQVYENDFRSVNIGTHAVVTTPSYPDKTFMGRVSYIDPRVDTQTRTAQVRIEVANGGEALKLGMFVDVSFNATAVPVANRAVTVSQEAIQMIGAKPVVFIATGQAGAFVQREVTMGPEANGLVPVYSGVDAGERVVTRGSFFLRAESMKLNPAQSLTQTLADKKPPIPDARAGSSQMTAAQPQDSGVQSVKILLTNEGYLPGSIRLKRNVPARLTFVRQVEVTCGTELSIPEFGITRDLPLNQPVVVEFTPQKKGEYSFACGMDMLRGKIIVQ